MGTHVSQHQPSEMEEITTDFVCVTREKLQMSCRDKAYVINIAKHTISFILLMSTIVEGKMGKLQYYQLILSCHYIVGLLAQLPSFFWPCLQYHQNNLSCVLISPNILSRFFITRFFIGHYTIAVTNFRDNTMSPESMYISLRNGVVK